ncbi:MAG: zinc ribbon domain-containing protein [Acidobacteria bacterium]|nr:zinc ribbon domain-containing protein [Acidobacteriota bacterium]
MPIYEFRCQSCRRKTTALVLVRARIGEVRCEHCGSGELERLWSRFAMVRSEESRLDALADPSALSGLDEQDPRSVARWMKRMGQELGEDVSSDEIDQMVEEELAGGHEGETAAPDAGAGGAGDETFD